MEFENFTLTQETLKIVKFPAPELKWKTQPVTQFDQNLKQTLHKMLVTMYRQPGCGLSANQVGINMSAFVTDTDCHFVRDDHFESGYRPENLKPRVFINPEIHPIGDEAEFDEGCLSFPELNVKLRRPSHIQIKFQDVNGHHHTLEAQGHFADCLQHEYDHLQGITFIDWLKPMQRQLVLRKWNKQKRR